MIKKFMNPTVIFIGIIVTLAIILLGRNRDITEHYTEDDVLTAAYVNDKFHGAGGGKQIVLSDRRSDGVIGNSSVPKQCTLVKAWFLEQIEVGSEIYKLSSGNSTILSLGRTDTFDCIENSEESISAFLKEREVAKRDVIRYDKESDLDTKFMLESENLYKDDLDRTYFAYYIGESDEETINRTFDIEDEFDRKSASRVKFFIMPTNLQKMTALNFKKTIGVGSN